MKRILSIAFVCVLLFTVAYSNAEDRFVDVDTGVSFAVPAGWTEVPNLGGNESIKIQYSPESSAGLTVVVFAVIDLFSAMGRSQDRLSRKDIDFTFLDDDLITAMLGPLEAKSNEVKQFGNYEYRVITCSMERTKNGLKFNLDCEMVVNLVNGYVLLFQYIASNNFDEYHPVFSDILKSVQIK